MLFAVAALAASLAGQAALPAGEAQLGLAADGRATIAVTINGEGPYPFILDTAASHTSIAEPLAVNFGFQPTGRLDDVQTLTAQIRSERLRLEEIDYGAARALGLNAVVVAVPSDLDLDVFGLLGNDAFGDRVARIDLAAGRLSLDGAPPAHEDARLDPIRNVPLTHISAARVGRSIPALIDTGLPRSLVNSAFARQTRHGVALEFHVMGVSRIGGTVETRTAVRLRRIRIGGVCLGRLEPIVADVDVFRALGWEDEPAMIIGLDALESAVITLDHDTGAVEISPAEGARCSA